MSNLIWYQELGFYSNPFSIKPAAFHNELFGNSSTIARVIKKMEEPGIIFVSGDFGTGKTSVLKKIIREFRGGDFGAKKIIYYNCNRSEMSIDYDKLLIGAGGFFSRLFRIKKKNMILLLDEVQDMNKMDLEMVKCYYDGGYFRSVVLVSKYDDLELTKELEGEIIGKRFVLGNITKNEAVSMIRKRIGDLEFFSDDIILKIFKKDGNSRSFLKNCEDVARVAFGCGAEVIEDKHIEKALG